VRATTITSPHADIEDVLCSMTRLKVLKVLMESEMLTVSEIAKKTSVNYVSARTHLETLERGEILVRVTYGKRIRYYKFKDSPIARAVKDLIVAYSDA
jgi:DNA-binding transcriptional ArsR family regulator